MRCDTNGAAAMMDMTRRSSRKRLSLVVRPGRASVGAQPGGRLKVLVSPTMTLDASAGNCLCRILAVPRSGCTKCYVTWKVDANKRAVRHVTRRPRELARSLSAVIDAFEQGEGPSQLMIERVFSHGGAGGLRPSM